MVVVGLVVVASGNSYSNRTHDRGDDNIDSGDVIVVMVKTIVVVAIYGGGGWMVALTVVMAVSKAGRMGIAACMRAKTIDFAAVPSPLILVTNSIAKPGL
ncbi:hypothetical protein PoB_004333500 [Plakobranchus ocellatus]|uniref:Uncharacterized protein n=1 Tax=Plakobranchus ocellatus TaxID=259542 RepID=A0AAV4BCL6_9GAST|nr:hypothetical protein PoB_004333500 [Plakobranchus ocellatus]